MDFSASSHLHKWILKEDEVKAHRERANEKGKEYVYGLRRQHGQPVDDLKPLAADEEYLLYSYYARLLAEKGKGVWSPKVTATAVTFIKRFFLHHSCMEHEVCEHYIDAESIAAMFPNTVKAEEVLGLETVVLGGLQFDLVVYQPYYYVAAMIEELKVALEASESDVMQLVNLRPGEPTIELIGKLAKSFTDSIINSDAVLVMTPQQQALCAVCHALEKYGMPHETVLERYTNLATDDTEKCPEVLNSLKSVLQRGNRLAAAGHQRCDKEVVTKLDKQNRAFNPLMDRTSALFKSLKKKKKKRKRDGESAT